MDLPFSDDYEVLETLYESERTVVCRATRGVDGQPVVVKALRTVRPSPNQLLQFRREFEIASQLKGEEFVQVLELERHGETPVIVMSDFGGQSLDKVLRAGRRFELEEFLELAIAIAIALGKLHNQGVIHRDLNPSNLVWNQQTGQLKIIDFGLSTRMELSQPQGMSVTNTTGTLPYMSPEQTGRTNRFLDYRSDYYSLGITLYELLTGRRPFETDDPGEMVYFHLVHRPRSPHHLRPEVPEALCQVLLKLIAKAAEDRYQSIHGLVVDLQECLRQWRASKAIEPFEPGREDVRSKLRMPHRLFGRAAEVEQLLECFEDIQEGARRLSLICGQSGIGKSTLVHSLQMPVVEAKGQFVEGKFEPQRRGTPYSACRQAMGQLVINALSQSDEKLLQWRRKVVEQLGDDLHLLVHVVPELELVFDENSREDQIENGEAKHRFQRAIQAFIGLFCGPHHPLVIFVDDLQWADEASLELIQLLIDNDELSHLWIIGAYRNQKVGTCPSLVAMLRRLRKQGHQVDNLFLQELEPSAVREFVARSLDTTVERAAPLADVVMQKTSGNPYFVEQFLTELHQRDLLWFDAERGRWCWDMDQIRMMPATENVVEMLTDRLRSLDESTREVVKYAALLGLRFDLFMLARICQLAPQEVFNRLQSLIDEGIVMPLSEPVLVDEEDPQSQEVIAQLGFGHDRLREAASRLLDPSQHAAAHLRVGRLLEPLLDDDDSSALFFSVVEHLNRGSQLIVDREERDKLVRRNIRAGKLALRAQGGAEARGFFEYAQQLLGQHAWSAQPELVGEVFWQRARTESMLGHFDEAQELVEEALDKINDPPRRADFHAVMIRQYTRQNEHEAALAVGEEALSELGVEMSLLDEDQVNIGIVTHFVEVEQKLADLSIPELAEISSVEDRRAEAALRLLVALYPPAGLFSLSRAVLTGVAAMSITLDIGPRPGSATALAMYGMVLTIRGDIERGKQAGQLAVNWARQARNYSELSRVLFVAAATINHWTRPLEQSLAFLREGHKAGLRSGNYLFAGYNFFIKTLYQFFRGEALKEVKRHARQGLEEAWETRNHSVVDMYRALLLETSNLLGETASPMDFSDQEFEDGDAFLGHCEGRGSYSAATTFRIGRAQIAYLYGHYEAALEELQDTGRDLGPLLGTFDAGRHPFYLALALAECCLQTEEGNAEKLRSELTRTRDELARLAQGCPQNYSHKLLLVDAEIARVNEEVEVAMDLYDRAIEEAQEQDFLHLEALANERAGLFWIDLGKQHFADLYLRAAHYAYGLWGAKRKVELLEERFRLLRHPPSESGSRSTSSGGDAIDVESVFRATEAIASKLDIDTLLPTLMRVTMENAGAERAVFVVVEQGELQVAVEGHVDGEPTTFEPRIDLEQWPGLPHSVIRFVQRTGDPLMLGRATRDPRFRNDPYIEAHRTRSVLCLPAAEQGEIQGILYAENNLADDAFSKERTRILQILADHIAISINKAKLYARLHEETERFRQLAENIQEVFWLMDWPSGQITYVSPAYEAMWGRRLPSMPLSIEEWSEPIEEEYRRKIITALRRRAATGEYDETYQIVRRSGTRRWIRDRGFPIRDPDGRIFRIAGVAMDITGEHEVAQMKEEFISVVSHELRTPLTPITGIFSMLVNEYEEGLPRGVREMAELGLRNSQRLLNLIDDLLDIQKLSMDKVTFNLEVLDVGEVLEEAVQFNQVLGAPRNISIEFKAMDEPVLVNVDRNRLLQVFTNLLSNAIKFSRDDEVVLTELSTAQGQAKIAITDKGPGIPAEARERIFEKFTQADSSLTRRHGGTGLGLAIARSIVTRLEGQLYFDTEEGEGTTFYVELPLATENL